jgi:hypothetical protein
MGRNRGGLRHARAQPGAALDAKTLDTFCVDQIAALHAAQTIRVRKGAAGEQLWAVLRKRVGLRRKKAILKGRDLTPILQAPRASQHGKNAFHRNRKVFMVRYISPLVISIFVSGCAVSLPEMSSDFLCQHFGNNYASETHRVPSIKAEIQARKLIPESEWPAVNRRELTIGMSRCGMYAVQGSEMGANSTTTASGTSVQHIFLNSNSLKREYVYTTNGVVTAWQK